MQRRTVLEAIGTVAAAGFGSIAGCTAPGSGDGGTTVPEDTSAETTVTTDTSAERTETTSGAEPTGGAQTTGSRYTFGGKVAGWQGRSPDTIAGKTNPTLELKAGESYSVTWENLDGVPHNFTIRDSDGANVTSTETMSTEGQTLTLTFTASEEMAQYICTIHPSTMVGNIEITSG